MESANHIIQKQIIDISFQSDANAEDLPQRLATIFYERLYPGMLSLFDELGDKDHYVKIEKLEIDNGILSASNWENEWVDNTLRSLRAELLAIDRKRIDHLDLNQQVIYFLSQGILPWNGQVSAVKELEEQVVIDHEFIENLKQLFIKQPITIRRLFQQFSVSFLKKLLVAIHETEPGLLQIAGIEQHLNQISNDAGLRELFMELFTQKPVDDNTISPSVDPPVLYDPNTGSLAGEVNEIFIENAGLVILHPFLSTLFDELQLWKDEKWVNEEMQSEAALLLQYMVSAGSDFSEFNMPLNKILCGIEMEKPLPSIITMKGDYQKECEDLLIAVIDHWKILKGTSIDGLRETFLHREGKLTRVDNGWYLQVERKGVDVLMDSLPWGIGTIKLPWMKKIIFTEWH